MLRYRTKSYFTLEVKQNSGEKGLFYYISCRGRIKTVWLNKEYEKVNRECC